VASGSRVGPSDENHGFFLAFLISAAAFVLSPGPQRAVRIMSALTWAVVSGVGLLLCVPEVMLRLAAWQRPIWIYRALSEQALRQADRGVVVGKSRPRARVLV
jgi:hypothetical protein